MSYIKAGYRSDKWKWVLSLPQVGSQAQKNVSKEPVPSQSDVPTEKEDIPEVVLTKDDKDVSENIGPPETSVTHQKNCTSQSSVSSHRTFSEDELTKEHVLKTFGMDRCPKTLPCQYVGLIVLDTILPTNTTYGDSVFYEFTYKYVYKKISYP